MMILETLKPFRLKDVILLILLSLLLNITNLIINYFNSTTTFYILLSTFYFILTLSLLLMNKTGTVLIFCLINVFIRDLFPTNNIYQKFALFLTISLVFEIIFLFFKLEFKAIKFDLLLGAAASSATIPWMLLYFSNTEITTTLLTNTINLSVINFLIGIIGASIALVFWHEIRKSKVVVRFEYE